MLLRSIATGAIRAVPWTLRKHIKKFPLIGPMQRWFVDTQLSGHPFVHEVDAGPAKGIRFEIRLPEDKGIWTGSYEEDFSRYVAESVEPGMVGYDIGAWHGFFTGIMLAQGAKQVVMFEPLPENLAALDTFIRLNPAHRVSVQNVALGAERGMMKLLQAAGSSMAKLEASPFQKGSATGRGLDVAVMPLDLIIQEQQLPQPDIIKIDIEGAELMMLEGAQETLSNARPLILAEIHSGELMQGVRQLLHRHDYAIDILQTSDTDLRESDAVQIRARRKSR
jgi:FkbM family methyltransferase